MVTIATSDDRFRDHELEGRLLLKVEAAARALDLSRAQVFSLIASGELPSVKIGRSRRVPVEALRQWVAAQSAA